jgi:23S rRNA (adenine2030-N6)-methyltransferase
MNYRHAFHAGNFADVLKHAALVAVLLHLRKKETPFAVIDAHGGRGLYDIEGSEARKTGEAARGIARLREAPSWPGVLAVYGDVVRGFGAGAYPGSPLIAAHFLRPGDRLIAIEKQEQEHAALVAALAGNACARVISGDSYRELTRLLPPRERRGVVLIDPPYEESGEFAAATRALLLAHRRFATGIYLLWYPAKMHVEEEAACGELLNAGIDSLLRIGLDIGAAPPDRARAEGQSEPMHATGLLVVNPPFGFADEMRGATEFLARKLAQGPGAGAAVEWLAER